MGWIPSYDDPRRQAMTAFCEGVIQTRGLVDQVMGGTKMAASLPTEPAPSIWKKLSNVMTKVDRIPKNGFNSFHKYNYATEADITEGVRGILAGEGLAFLPSVLSWERGESDAKGNFLTRVEVKFTLADTESGQTVESIFWGEGHDNMDKGFYKAYTGAVKYFLMKTLLIPTGDDPEDDGGSRAQQQVASQQKQQKQQAQSSTPKREQPQPQRPVGVPVGSPATVKTPVSPELVGQTIARAVDAGLTFDNLKEYACSQIRQVNDLTELTPPEFDKVIKVVDVYIASKKEG